MSSSTWPWVMNADHGPGLVLGPLFVYSKPVHLTGKKASTEVVTWPCP